MRPKFRPYLSKTEAAAYLNLIATTAIRAADPQRTERLSPDPSDDYLVALTESVRADHLVSGDKHLLGLERPNLSVLNPAAFLETLTE